MLFADVWERSARETSRGFPIQNTDCLLWTGPDGNRHCLVPVGPGPVPQDERVAAVLNLRCREVNLEGRPSATYCDLECGDRDGFEIFDYFIHDLTACGVPAISSLAAKLADYRHFWRRPAATLDAAAAVGLFGELWFLDQWLGADIGSGFRSWTGPLGSLHDFAWTNADVEVKTSQGLPPKHAIARIEQLLPAPGKRLLVFSLALRRDAGVGTRLTELVDQVADRLRAVGYIAQLHERIARLGYRPDDPQNSGYRYVILRDGERLYEVRDEFPRITDASFVGAAPPEGVGGVSYEISLAGCDHLRLPVSAPIDPAAILGAPDT